MRNIERGWDNRTMAFAGYHKVAGDRPKSNNDTDKMDKIIKKLSKEDIKNSFNSNGSIRGGSRVAVELKNLPLDNKGAAVSYLAKEGGKITDQAHLNKIKTNHGDSSTPGGGSTTINNIAGVTSSPKFNFDKNTQIDIAKTDISAGAQKVIDKSTDKPALKSMSVEQLTEIVKGLNEKDAVDLGEGVSSKEVAEAMHQKLEN